MGCHSRSGGLTFRLAAKFPMIILIKISLALFLIGWSGLGLWMLVKYDHLFGDHPDDPAESSGARALNVTQVSSVWFGFFAVAFYFLIS